MNGKTAHEDIQRPQNLLISCQLASYLSWDLENSAGMRIPACTIHTPDNRTPIPKHTQLFKMKNENFYILSTTLYTKPSASVKTHKLRVETSILA